MAIMPTLVNMKLMKTTKRFTIIMEVSMIPNRLGKVQDRIIVMDGNKITITSNATSTYIVGNVLKIIVRIFYKIYGEGP